MMHAEESRAGDILPFGIAAAATAEEAARLLGQALELPDAAPLEATRRALRDPLYARALWSSRKIPALRDQIIAAASRIRISDTDGDPHSAGAASGRPSAAALAGKAAGSLLRWGMAGLKPAPPWVIERRLAACAACPHQKPAPDRLIYRGAEVFAGKDARICGICHCLTNTKAAISTELCPGPDPENPETSRWGDPWVPPENHVAGPW